jgi:uncharacterized membrane protein
MLAATVFVACRAPRWLAIPLGLLLAVKQYSFLLLPLVFFLMPEPSPRSFVRLVLAASAIAIVITLPWALWNPKAFYDAVILFQMKQPFRPDALSFMAATAEGGMPKIPMLLCFAMVLPALGIVLVRSPRTPSGFAAGGALVYLFFFAFAKQAFCNYYSMVVGTLCVAAAAATDRTRPREPAR